MANGTNDGGKNKFYGFPEWANDVDGLARFLKLTFAEGNILKSLTTKIGKRHNGTNEKRETKKCLHYSIDRMLDHGFTGNEIMEQVSEQLGISIMQFGLQKE